MSARVSNHVRPPRIYLYQIMRYQCSDVHWCDCLSKVHLLNLLVSLALQWHTQDLWFPCITDFMYLPSRLPRPVHVNHFLGPADEPRFQTNLHLKNTNIPEHFFIRNKLNERAKARRLCILPVRKEIWLFEFTACYCQGIIYETLW